ncbi:M15 family metallopeptidase [Weissella coleopterorum]|uniref:M15 family metallopeptidase n=1 Tax=Weissella coleopterorum TaxID=2714949 RepID=A0A6G8B009_9LACO|nr:M15 family metallopeptidase [Weissella coleopterorum]QIL50681.1 M15 family metallopeptidase [Weissella coleopterorum]
MFKKLFLPILLIICALSGLVLILHNSAQQKPQVQSSQPITQKNKHQTYKTDHNLIVVNKKHPLNQNYNPFNGAIDSNNPNGAGLSKATNQAKTQIISDLQTAGFPISDQVSGYRSFNYQTTLYNNYVTSHGQKEADTFSARPGYSEHQSGLAFDLTGQNGQLPTDDKLYHWLQNNAHKYGLIIRFPRNSSAKTGYMGEEWHLRYIGVKNATKMYQKKIKTLEEFTGIIGGDYHQDARQDQMAVKE